MTSSPVSALFSASANCALAAAMLMRFMRAMIVIMTISGKTGEKVIRALESEEPITRSVVLRGVVLLDPRPRLLRKRVLRFAQRPVALWLMRALPLRDRTLTGALRAGDGQRAVAGFGSAKSWRLRRPGGSLFLRLLKAAPPAAPASPPPRRPPASLC